MQISRYLAFEINKNCNLAKVHEKYCPNLHPERYIFSKSDKPITSNLIFKFWRWCVEVHHFRGIINWNGYNEPSLVIDQINEIIRRVRAIDPWQPFQIVTNNPTMEFPNFDLVKRSLYNGDGISRDCNDTYGGLDNRIASIRGEGKPYSKMTKHGRCIRGCGFAIEIDYYGNWNLCCNDWRCEESCGNIHEDDWEALYLRWKGKSHTKWTCEEEYNKLPRLCRACMDVVPSISLFSTMCDRA